MGKSIKLTESELQKIIEKIIEEQNLNMGQEFQQKRQSSDQAAYAAKQAAKQAIGKAVNTGVKAVGDASIEVAKFGKQVVVTIGKVVFNVVIYGTAIVFLIGKGVYKVTAAIGNALLKFLSSTGKATVSGATAITKAGLITLTAAGIMVSKGAKYVSAQLNSLKDSGISIVKWIINQFKQFGTMMWGKILIAATSVKEWAGALGGWIKQQYDTIAQQVGVAFNDAVSGVKKIGQKVAGAVSKGVDAVQGAATNIANRAAGMAGSAVGAIQGFLREFFERYNSFTGTDSLTILSESVKYNGLSIL
jgi:phosphopantetheinyl transferase (holo-ACP synthase)